MNTKILFDELKRSVENLLDAARADETAGSLPPDQAYLVRAEYELALTDTNQKINAIEQKLNKL